MVVARTRDFTELLVDVLGVTDVGATSPPGHLPLHVHSV